MWKCGNTGLRRLAKTPGLDRLPSSSTYTHIRFYFDTYAFWKITTVFSWTDDAHQALAGGRTVPPSLMEL
jgi:hypothetical protein